MRVVVVPGHEDLATGPAPESVDQAVRRPVHGDIAQTDHRVVVQHVARPLLQQVAVAVVAVPERAAEDGDARLVFEVRVGEDPRPVFVRRGQPRAQETPGCLQHGAGGAPVVSGKALVRDLSGQSAPRRAVEAQARSCPLHDGNRLTGHLRSRWPGTPAPSPRPPRHRDEPRRGNPGCGSTGRTRMGCAHEAGRTRRGRP